MTDYIEVIPGFYAAGSDANNIYDTIYVALVGNYMGFAVNMGRIAAENAITLLMSYLIIGSITILSQIPTEKYFQIWNDKCCFSTSKIIWEQDICKMN